ncbi:NAD(P)-binding protein [Trametopsis cervina]|nr:NAD(P)-binding protein [Trametopsis cervina]
MSTALTALGGAVALKAAYDLSSFLYTHLLQRPAYGRYLYGHAPYALVTGASDGIGKAVAHELYARGFNLVIHGRSAEKLAKVQQEILASDPVVKRDVKLWIADASAADVDFEGALKQWEDIEITLVIHNVGGTEMKASRVDTIPTETLFSDLNRNAIFPWLLTRALLPKLRTARGPVQLVYVGSVAADMPIPGLIPYGATKAFLRQLSITLDADERFFEASNVSMMYLSVGSVVSNSNRVDQGLFAPDTQTFAKSLVAKIGCGKRKVFAYLPHAVQLWSTGFLPEALLNKLVADAQKEQIRVAKKI